MSDEPIISYSFHLGEQNLSDSLGSDHTKVASGSVKATLYAVDQYDSYPLADGVLLVGKTTGAQLLLAQEVALVLPHCTVFRSLEQHAKHLVSVFPQLGGNVDDALRVLSHVRDAGLFISADQICAEINQAAAEPAPRDRSKVFIITCDRPAAVQRLLESMLANAKLARQKQLYLIDDSRDASNASLNREAVEQFNLLCPVPVNYVGSVEQQSLINHLISAMPNDREAIEFLLTREPWGKLKTYGRARSLCLLLSVGDRCVVMDDDVLCLALKQSDASAAARFSNGMAEAHFYRDLQEWQGRWQKAEFDPLLGHTRCLGMGLAEALAELGLAELQPQQLEGVSALPFLGFNANTPVLVTQSGTVGDPGTANNAWLANMSLNSIKEMLAAPGGLMNALATRQCWVGHPQAVVLKRAVMSQVTGLDNRHLLPPYFPAMRGEDQLFGAMLEFLMPDSAVLEYDWAVPHLPLEERQGNRSGDSVVPRGGLQLLSSYLAEGKPSDRSLDLGTRLSLLAARLESLAALSTQGLQACFRSNLTRRQALMLQTLNDRLQDSAALDESWQQYLQSNAQDCMAALQQVTSLSDLPQVPEHWNNERVADEIRRCAKYFARALLAWPKMREAALTFEL